MDITATDLPAKLSAHARWLAGDEDGVRADLSGVDLSRADLRGADLSGADLSRADLRRASLSRANLSGADLSWVDLSWADLRDANLDFSCWPLWCGSRGAVVDTRIAAQLAAHFCALDCDDPAYQEARAALLPFARTSHRAKDLGLIEDEEDHHD